MIEVDDILGGELQSAVCDHFLEFGKDPGGIRHPRPNDMPRKP